MELLPWFGIGSDIGCWNKTGNRKYFDYVLSYADSIVNNDGSIKTYRPEEYSLDRLNTGKILFPIYQQTKNEKYRLALNLLRKQVEKHPKTLIGVFWHKKIYPHQVWLDGIYMGCPFLAEYAATFDEPELFDLVAHQIIETYRVTKDINTGLLFHGWDESREQRWSDPVTVIRLIFGREP
jgi:unsaturated rhamnogalacturonyl hydrolase